MSLPTDRAGLQGEIERSILIRGQGYTHARLGAISDRADEDAVLPGGKILDAW